MSDEDGKAGFYAVSSAAGPEAGQRPLEHPGGGVASPEEIPDGWQSGKGGL